MKENMKGHVVCALLIILFFLPGAGMSPPWEFSMTNSNEMIASDSQAPERTKGDVKISRELQDPKQLVQKVRGPRRPKLFPITKPPLVKESTPFFFDYEDTNTDRLAQISRFIGESPKQRLKVALNSILKFIQIGHVFMLIFFLIYQILCWGCERKIVPILKKTQKYQNYLSQGARSGAGYALRVAG